MQERDPERRLFIANRGEVAMRIVRAAREEGIKSIVPYAQTDANSLAVRNADYTINLDGSSASETYLDSDKLLSAAIQMGATMVHPGYGFLSENHEFARQVRAEGLIFVGPSEETMRVMAEKSLARNAAEAVGVPVIPATESFAPEETAKYLDQLRAFAESHQLPVMIKAVAGGSGRGMRVCETNDQLEDLIQEAGREAQQAFNDSRVFIEKFIPCARHIEVQVLGDEHGKMVILGERECSVQRRNQKLIEEAPALIPDAARAVIRDVSRKLVDSVSYCNAGTIEYLLDEQGQLYFLEMNTRLQVEHPVTEMVTGVDIVRAQLRVALGEPLAIEESDITQRGHAIEFRIFAEDTARNFFPTPGSISSVTRIGGMGVREDTWVDRPTTISPYFDSLISKVIVWGSSRDEAIERARSVLSEYKVEGVPTTLDFHRWMLNQRDYIDNAIDIKWVERHWHGCNPS